MDALVAEYLAEQQEFAALTSLLSEARVAAARPFDARVERRITVAGLEQSLLCNEEVLSQSVFPAEDADDDADPASAPSDADDTASSEASKESAVHREDSEASAQPAPAATEAAASVEDSDHEEQTQPDDTATTAAPAAAPAGTGDDPSTAKEEEGEAETEADDEDEKERLRCVRDIWESILVRLDDLQSVQAPESALPIALRLGLLFVEVRQAFAGAEHLPAGAGRQLTAIVTRVFGTDTIEETGKDELDRALRTLQRARPARRRDAAYRCLVTYGVQFTYATLVSLLKRYFCELRAALGPSTLSLVAADLARGVYAPGRPACTPDATAVAEARASLGQVRQSLEVCRRSLARIVKDPLPDALGKQPQKQQQQQQQQEQQQAAVPETEAAPRPPTPKKKGHRRRRSSESVPRSSSSNSNSSNSSSSNSEKTEQQKALATVSPEPPANVQARVLQPDKDLLDLLNRGEPVAKVRRLKRPFTAQEETNLREGVKRYGVGNWRLILMAYTFDNRTTVDLKDKWRNLQKMERRAQKRAIEDIAANGLPDTLDE